MKRMMGGGRVNLIVPLIHNKFIYSLFGAFKQTQEEIYSVRERVQCHFFD